MSQTNCFSHSFQQKRRHRLGFVDLPFNIEAHDGQLTVAPNPVGETIFRSGRQ